MNTYQILSQNTQDDIIVSFMLSQEKDRFCHELNIQRYKTMLKTLPMGTWRNQIEKLLNETESRLAETNSIIKASSQQLPGSERIQLAIIRLEASKKGVEDKQ